ncbi:orotidine-5'-phosphate decarboxylase [Methanopyrus sp. KOL6]|uniref:orotidine-5'-phosphate decarboxylase n=1 Tax=Methanopyrus sp. KOL6 TaxID=1937004 RepID=UPI0012F91960|nr:orotidine-5'-phosphate decarboxylase [Methanopyrus sp. KOL6]
MLEPDTRLIVALDVSPDRAVEIAETLDGYVDGFKVGYEVVLAEGAAGIERVAGVLEESFLLVDLKTADIPEISRSIVERVSEAGADATIIHGFVGPDVVEECARVLPVFVVATMSHPGAREFYDRACQDIVKACDDIDGVIGYVAPATRPERVLEVRKITDKLIVSPGVGAQGAAPGDGVRAGADFEIIGRAITEAHDPIEAAKDLVRAMMTSRPAER